jgi:excinuclease ABC subunit C
MQKLLEGLPKILTRQVKELPETAGIYIFFKGKTPIYIGKAINLKRRVSSYFDLDLEPKTAKMIAEAANISFIQVNSELEALLLEAKLIKTYMPRYNIVSKDDKHPLYIQITREKFPRIITARRISGNERNIAFYGPFPSSKNVYTVLKMLRHIFPYSDHKIGRRGCIYSHIGQCNPCPNEIVQKEILSTEYKILRTKYLKNIRSIKSILDGNIEKVSSELEKEMKIFSNNQKFEEAAYIRNQISRLEYITQPALPSEFYIENPNLYEDVRKRELTDLKKILNIKNLTRIECFDVAHLSGTNAVASMVTFIDGEADKNYYRHFKIRRAKGGDDYDSMREIARRRALHFNDWGIPDLIIVDGGLGQIKAFTTLIHINIVPVIGIAKHPDRLVIGDKKIKLTGEVLNLVSRIRDEAHRFARRYHHSLISKSITNAGNN